MNNGQTFADRLCAVTNAHDLDALTQCFTDDYRNETPAHPERGFVGRDQVRANWQQIFAAVPDVHTEVLRSHSDGNIVWSEWEMRGTRRDGSAHLMRGVILFGVEAADGEAGRASWARFYLEPVEERAGTVARAVSNQVGAGPA
jgi:ketosteroid isomerase-like protein